MMGHQSVRIAVITPTRNEAQYIRTTIECMSNQTVLPMKWIIVNDGSTDGTGNIIQEYLNDKYPFIEYMTLPDRGYRKPGQGVIEAFYHGFNRLGSLDYDVIAKFDADLEFPPDTLEKIGKAFQNDPLLGITGGTQYEQLNSRGPFRKLYAPQGYVCGPSKFYRLQCLKEIGGLIPRAGWDGVDIVRANMHGWKTGSIGSLRINHLKPTGMAAGEGLRKSSEKYGDVSYFMGGYKWYFALRLIARSLESKNPKVGYFMLKGYLNSFMRKEPREQKDFRSFLKQMQREHVHRLISKIIRLEKLRD